MPKKQKKAETALVLRNAVYQSNPLVQARKDFDIIATRIFLLGLRGLNPHLSDKDKYFDADFKEMFIPTSKLTELFGDNTKYLSELKKSCTKLFNVIVELNYADGGFKLMHLFDELDYKPKEGLYLKFSHTMRPYILDLFQSRGYTRINVEYLFKLSSPYAVRLLELLLQYQNIRAFKQMMEIKRKLTIEELRFALNVPEGAYSNRMNNFRKYVLDDPIKEINERTPYIVRYEPIKEGRRVVGFEFTMDTYNVPKDDESVLKPKFGNDAIKALCALGFTERVARAIFAKCYDTADCFSRINRAEALLARNKRPIKNKQGFLRKAIEEEWQVGQKPAVKQKATSSRALPQTDSFMTPLAQCLPNIVQSRKTSEESVEDKPKYFNIGRKKISYVLATTFMGYIRRQELLDLVEENLREEYNTTIEKFTKLCEKHGI